MYSSVAQGFTAFNQEAEPDNMYPLNMEAVMPLKRIAVGVAIAGILVFIVGTGASNPTISRFGLILVLTGVAWLFSLRARRM